MIREQAGYGFLPLKARDAVHISGAAELGSGGAPSSLDPEAEAAMAAATSSSSSSFFFFWRNPQRRACRLLAMAKEPSLPAPAPVLGD
jgi:hypothetical protein